MKAGELVVKRTRWSLDANRFGFVIGHNWNGHLDEWLVMWTTDDQRIEFRWHLADALWIVDNDSLANIKDRERLGT